MFVSYVFSKLHFEELFCIDCILKSSCSSGMSSLS